MRAVERMQVAASPPAPGVLDPDSATGLESASPPAQPLEASGPAITGRVLGLDGAPAPGAELRWVLDQPAQRLESSSVCDGQGRFAIPLRTGGLTLAELDALGPTGGRKRVRLQDVPAHGMEVGDLRLEATRELWFLVRGHDGKPDAEATVSTLGERPVVSTSAAAPGVCVLRHVDWQDAGFLVHSPRYQAQIVRPAPGEGSADAPVLVRLRLPAALLVEISTPAGLRSWDGQIQIDVWEALPFRGPAGRKEPPPENDARGGSSFRVRSTALTAPAPGQPMLTLTYQCKDGRCEVLALRPDAAVEVSLVDDLGQRVDRRRVAPEQLDAREPIRFLLREEACELEVRVTDASGQPVLGANVSAPGSRAGGRGTNSRGEVRFSPVQGARVDLEARKAGYAPTLVRGVPLDPPFTSAEVVLQEGLTLRVAAVDPQGRPVRIAEVAAREGQRGVADSLTPAQDGSHTLIGLPARNLELGVRIGHVLHTRQHDPRQGDLVLEVPEVGSLEVRLDQPLEAFVLAVLLSTDVAGASQQVTHAPRGDALRIDLGAVVPGSYALELRSLRDGEWRTLWRRDGLVVRAGETTSVPLATGSLARD